MTLKPISLALVRRCQPADTDPAGFLPLCLPDWSSLRSQHSAPRLTTLQPIDGPPWTLQKQPTNTWRNTSPSHTDLPYRTENRNHARHSRARDSHYRLEPHRHALIFKHTHVYHTTSLEPDPLSLSQLYKTSIEPHGGHTRNTRTETHTCLLDGGVGFTGFHRRKWPP